MEQESRTSTGRVLTTYTQPKSRPNDISALLRVRLRTDYCVNLGARGTYNLSKADTVISLPAERHDLTGRHTAQPNHPQSSKLYK